MVWHQLAIDKPHLVYLIVGGFTSLFMLCSLLVKEKLYIGEATVATICGVIFGPHAANLIDPKSWGNLDKITLEFSRIVLVVQCFAVGVELPKAYMERHWRSVSFLLLPVMAYGWLATSLFIWWMVPPLNWLESLACAACVTATDPVLAASVVGKGKFAKRVPKHLRDVLSAESGCNDGMAFPFIYLSLYLIRYAPHSGEVFYHWFCFTVLYECVFGAVFGFLVGYIGRHAIKLADKNDLIDRESFLVFYFVLALFCAGSGSLLGLDDLLVGFAAGVGFSNDGWFTQKTEESHVSNVIDLLLNLTYFVFLGAIIPWAQFNSPEIGLVPWRLVVIALMVILFRRIPIMLALKPIIPDVKSWREALFAGYFGPIGVGAVFAAILARAELENDSTDPLPELPGPEAPHYILIQVIWPITAFLVISSILVHGSSIAVFTLGKRINTLTLTMTYTQAEENGPSWMNRLPRVQSRSRSMSKGKDEFNSTDTSNEKLPQYPPGALPPIGTPGNFLRRQREEDNPSNSNSRASSLRPTARRKRWDSGRGPGGPISQSAITPQRRTERPSPPGSTSGEPNENFPDDDEDEAPDGIEVREAADRKEETKKQLRTDPEVEAYDEGDELVVEDEEGNVLSVDNVRGETAEQKKQHIIDDIGALREETSGKHAKDKAHPHTHEEGEQLKHNILDDIEHPSHPYRNLKKKIGNWTHKEKHKDSTQEPKPPEQRRGPAHAYQYGNTIIVEDEDGEVVKKYEISGPEKQHRGNEHNVRQRLQRMGTWAGFMKGNEIPEDSEVAFQTEEENKAGSKRPGKSAIIDDDDDRIRFTVTAGGRRLSKQDFIKEIQALDPKARAQAVEESDVPESVKRDARAHARGYEEAIQRSDSKEPEPSPHFASYQFPPASSSNKGKQPRPSFQEASSYQFPPPSGDRESQDQMPEIRKVGSNEDRPAGDEGLTLVDSHGEEVPFYAGVSDALSRYTTSGTLSAAQRRRAAAKQRHDSENDGAAARVPPSQQQRRRPAGSPELSPKTQHSTLDRHESTLASTSETNAERRRRLAALGEGEGRGRDSDSDDDGGERKPTSARHPVTEPASGMQYRPAGIRFADSPAVSQGRVQWGEDVGRKGKGR